MSRTIWITRILAIASIALCFGVIAFDTVNGWPRGTGQIAVVLINTTVALTYVAMGWLSDRATTQATPSA